MLKISFTFIFFRSFYIYDIVAVIYFIVNFVLSVLSKTRIEGNNV